MNPTGLLTGFFMLLMIGFGFFWVIKLEYYVGAHIWKGVLSLGIILSLGSLWIPSFWGSALLGIVGGSIAWGATELPDQAERVRRGIFPANPRRGFKKGPQ
jgi:hypothetical protein